MGGEWLDTVGTSCALVCFAYGKRMEGMKVWVEEGLVDLNIQMIVGGSQGDRGPQGGENGDGAS